MVFRLDDTERAQSDTARPAPGEEALGHTTKKGDRRSNAVFAASLLAIMLVALIIRALPLTNGLPYTSYVDEHFVLRPAATMIADRTWEPGAYNYPPLTMYATAAAGAVLHILPGGESVGSAARATVDQPIASNIHSSDLILGGRVVVLAFSAGIVLMSALLALRLMGRRTALVAALLTATLPALVTRSAIVIVDTPAAFFATASLYCASHVSDERRGMLWAVLGGAAAGLAAAAKYPTGVVILAVITVIALSRERSVRDRVVMTCGSLAACAAAAAIAAPTLLFRPGEVLDEFRTQSEIYDTKVTTTYWHELLRGNEVGTLLLVIGVVGCLQLLRSTRTRPLMIGVVLFAAALVVPLEQYSFQPFRNLLPLLPFLGVAAAVAIVAAVDAAGRLVHAGRWPRAAVALAISFCLCAVMVTSARRHYYDQRIDVTDSRIQARQWLADRVDRDDAVLVASEVAFLPSELARIPGRVTVRSLTRIADPIETTAFEYVVVGDYRSAKEWRSALADRRIGIQYGKPLHFTQTHPLSYRDSQQIIRVFEASGTRDPRECFPLCG